VAFEEEDIERCDDFIFSPGFAAGHPWRELVTESGRACLSEIAFAASYWEGKMIGITGTNGKSTLTALLDEAFRMAGHSSVAAGNIGHPFSDAVCSEVNQVNGYAVLEISSFQAELSDGLELDALLWTNFAEDHLDRYASIAHYFRAKAQLFDCLKPDGICVIGPQVADWMANESLESRFCIVARGEDAASLQLSPDSVFHRFPYSENFSIAAEFWSLLGRSPVALIEAGNVFTLAPHRLSVIALRGGTRFWNDSKATNFHATLAALKSVNRPVVWIGGGRAKGGDVESFATEVAAHVDAAVLYGEVADRLAAALRGSLATVEVVSSFEDAVRAAAQLAEEMAEADVLLSPGFASFDQFDSYQARGKSFIDTVLSLKNTHKPR
jgi:UDP-N-acetylmuramoylalanine--D-glutamate ligase